MAIRHSKQKTITICSSTSFYKDVLEIERELNKFGLKVKVPANARKMQKSGNYNEASYRTWYKNPEHYKKKTALINGHFKKISEADAILVINKTKRGIRGYIGGNALMEMTLAYIQKKPIFLWNDISSKSPIEEEVRGLNPIIVGQDITKIRF